jgi:NADPH:quinone reductase
MKAVLVHEFGEPSVLKYEEAPEPVAGRNQVVVRVKAAGVNPVETYIRAGRYGPRAFPFIPGNDAGGTIESVGAEVKRVSVGDRVYIAGAVNGTYAELALADALKVHPLPDNMSFAQGAALGIPYGTAYRALYHRAEIKSGETVLVHGATGGVGIASVQLAARDKSIRIIATGGTSEGRDLVNAQGAHLVLDHRAASYTDDLLKFTEHKGVDVILEMLANVNLGKDLPLLAKRGRVLVIGSRGRVEIDPRDTMSREADIRGVMLAGATDDQYAQMHADIRAGLTNGALKPIIARELPLKDAANAHEMIMNEPHLGKISLIP